MLDIFGFEKFEVNSLEQLCINYANEKLQAQFIEALVASQRAEYEAEGIGGGSIDFPDNSMQLRLSRARLVYSHFLTRCNPFQRAPMSNTSRRCMISLARSNAMRSRRPRSLAGAAQEEEVARKRLSGG